MESKPVTRKTGEYEPIGEYNHFTPSPLPPADPPFQIDDEIFELYGKVQRNIGLLEGKVNGIPDKERLLQVYIANEALLSSQIEGTQASLQEILEYDAKEKSRDNPDVEEVLNYVKAVNFAHKKMHDENFPIVNRLIKEAHEILLKGARGKDKSPGNFRKIPVWIGGSKPQNAKFVPPSADKIEDLFAGLEKFINEYDSIDPIIKAGLAHVMFETIHPFIDGNGRIGRLLIVMMLLNDGVISAPVLYPSYCFKKTQMEYYHRLNSVRTEGDWEGWIKYFLRALDTVAIDAYTRAEAIEQIRNETVEIIAKEIPQSSANALKLLDELFSYPTITANNVTKITNVSRKTANNLISKFVDLDILKPDANKKRNISYHFERYLKILEKEGTF